MTSSAGPGAVPAISGEQERVLWRHRNPLLLCPADGGMGCRSHYLAQTKETTSKRFSQFLLATSKLWKHFAEPGFCLHPICTGSGSARYMAGQRHTYSIAQPGIKGKALSLNACLESKPLSFRALTASVMTGNKKGSHIFSPLVLAGITEDRSCKRHRTWLQMAPSLRRSLPMMQRWREKHNLERRCLNC